MFDWRCVQRMEKLAGSEDLVWKAAKPMLQVYIPLKACDAFGPRERVQRTHSCSDKSVNELPRRAKGFTRPVTSQIGPLVSASKAASKASGTLQDRLSMSWTPHAFST